jgi:hypothetical protein
MITVKNIKINNIYCNHLYDPKSGLFIAKCELITRNSD